MANFDAVAPFYRWLEYASFGPMLARCRRAQLPRLLDARQALIFGDGDGRFTAALLRRNPRVVIDAVDSSPAMLRRLAARAARAARADPARLRLHCADALGFAPPRAGYDLVVTHFFLDCLAQSDLDAWSARLAPYLDPHAQWIVSEFAIPPGRARWLARPVVAALYRAFGLLAHLQAQSLPDHASALARQGFRLARLEIHLAGLLRSEAWQR